MLPLLPQHDAATLPGVLDLTPQDWRAWLEARGEKPFRAKQIRQWIFARAAQSFDDMTDLPRSLRQALVQSFTLSTTRIARHLEADDGTHKLLLELRDGKLVECVLIQEEKRRTVCVSTQVGCGMGCVFCASGLEGLERNLSVTEILEQLLHLRRMPPIEPFGDGDGAGEAAGPARLTHIVVMGMGEPLVNLDNLLEALEIASSPDGLGIGARHITISTVGLPGRIRQLAESGKQYHLAVSLHAPNEILRQQIVPTTDKMGLQAILDAADDFFNRTGRQVTFEYVLLSGVNDHPAHAEELGRLLRGRKAHINVIPFNEVDGLPYRAPEPHALANFLDRLRTLGISIKVRKRKGSRIQAACGQLRRASAASA